MKGQRIRTPMSFMMNNSSHVTCSMRFSSILIAHLQLLFHMDLIIYICFSPKGLYMCSVIHKFSCLDNLFYFSMEVRSLIRLSVI